MRDPQQTGYAPHPVPGVTPVQRIAVSSTSVPCDGATPDGLPAPLGHPRVWLRIDPGADSVTCPYCSITYVLTADALTAGPGLDGH